MRIVVYKVGRKEGKNMYWTSSGVYTLAGVLWMANSGDLDLDL